MFKKIVIGILTICFVLSSIGIATAEGNKRKGKYAYRNIYKSCFENGATDSQKPPVDPDSKTMAQWKRVFENKDFGDFGCTDEWNKLSDEELQDIYAYLYEGAADSPTPAKCK